MIEKLNYPTYFLIVWDFVRGEVLAELRQSDFEPAITAVGRID